jgi:DNA-binding IclR family transcriptional regulator
MGNDREASGTGTASGPRTGNGNGTALVQSVDRAIGVLEILARGGPATVTEIAGQIGVHRSTAFRLLAVLEGRGLVEQLEERGRYQLGFGIIRLAGATTARLDLVRESRPVCERLAAELGETVNVAILDADAAVNVDQVRGPASVTSYNWVGQRTPLHATSSGKVLLAHQPPIRQAQLLGGSLERFTPNTRTDPAQLRVQLAEAVERGYAFTVEELELGLNAVAAPIRLYDGSVVGAVSASGPSYRLTPERVPEAAAAVVRAAAEISDRLGYPGPGPTAR